MSSLFSLQSLRDLVAGVDWHFVKLAVIVAGVAVVKGWLGSSLPPPDRLVPSSPMADADADYNRGVASPSPQRWAKKKSLDEELGFAALELESPDTSFGASALTLSSPSPSPPPPKRKAKKSVAFAEDLNEVHVVENWFDPSIHKHREIRFRWGIWEMIEVSRWIEPDGHNQLHFPRTKWVRDVPDWSVEDQDGDVEMGEDADVEMSED